MRKLASVRKIGSIQSIPNADNIELAIVDGWKLVVRKGEFKEGDICIYCEIDSFLPIRPEFEFLHKSCYKQLSDGTEGYRIRSIKLRGCISQGLLIKINDLPELNSDLEEGQDVTDLLGIRKYEPPIPAQLTGVVKGMFPSFIPKTDEERLQNLANQYEELRTNTYYVTEKLDGSSVTFYVKEGVFGTCSRNLDLLESPGNTYWKVAQDMELPDRLIELSKHLNKDIAIQGELIGEGIQGNSYKIKGHKVYFFNGFDISLQRRLTYPQLTNMMKSMYLEMVPLVKEEYILPESIDELLNYADGKSKLDKEVSREGLVLRTSDMGISFKAISNKWLLKNE